jgi:formate/nitrite transporter FocA (FNT family)
MFYNLLWVSIGNIIAGVVFVGFGYFLANGRATPAASVNPAAVPAE